MNKRRSKLQLLAPADSRQDRARFRASLRPTDVFLVGHPRSGNTWLAYLLAILLEGGDPTGRITVANIGEFVPVIHGHDALIFSHDEKADPRIFRNERPNHPALYPRSLFIVRDPRSTLVSYFHYYKTLAADARLTLDEFIAAYLTDGCIASFEPEVVRWDHQVREWIDRSAARPVMIIRYEDLHRDRRSFLEKIAAFCAIAYTDDAMSSALERGTFEAMQRQEGRHGVEPQHPPDPPSRGWFFRQGETAGWKTELSPTAVGAIEKAFGPTMAALGYASSS